MHAPTNLGTQSGLVISTFDTASQPDVVWSPSAASSLGYFSRPHWLGCLLPTAVCHGNTVWLMFPFITLPGSVFQLPTYSSFLLLLQWLPTFTCPKPPPWPGRRLDEENIALFLLNLVSVISIIQVHSCLQWARKVLDGSNQLPWFMQTQAPMEGNF